MVGAKTRAGFQSRVDIGKLRIRSTDISEVGITFGLTTKKVDISNSILKKLMLLVKINLLEYSCAYL